MGWGRSLRRAVGRWYTTQRVEALAYQAVKYRRREGVTHRDLLRLTHPAEQVSAGNPTLELSDEHARLFEWIVRGGQTDGLPRVIEGFVRAQQASTPAATAALALVTAATKPHYETVGFFAGRRGWKSHTKSRWAFGKQGLTPLAIRPRQRLDDVVETVSDLPFGGTDCALPMLYVQARKREVDAFVIFTDSKTWAGDVHPVQALRDYRRASGIDARLASSAWSRMASRSPTRPTRGCSTSSGSTPRRRS